MNEAQNEAQKVDLRPCPFCGASRKSLEVGYYDTGVLCHGCEAWMPAVMSSNPGESHSGVEGWNRRAVTKADECLGDLWLAMEEALGKDSQDYQRVLQAYSRRRQQGGIR